MVFISESYQNCQKGVVQGYTPTKRQVSKRQASKRLVSKRLKRQVYKTSGLQNVRFTKRQGYSVLVVGGNTQVLLQHVCRESDGCVLFSILEGFLAVYHHNK